MESVPLVNVLRSGLIESRHRGILSLVNGQGEELFALGNTKHTTYIRSSAKPIQALPLVMTGAADKYKLSDKELALICASHNGEKIHVETVKAMLAKIDLDENALECGSHLPYLKEEAARLLMSEEKLSPLYNNCSGKHAGMLILCKHLGWPLSGYSQREHPLQELMYETIAELADLDKSEIHLGIDGCGVIVFAMPIHKAAYLFSRLANPTYLPLKYQEAANRITKAMINEPYMVAGKGRTCTDLMKGAKGKIVAKGGAEGFYGLGVCDGNLGLAVKIEDGNSRALDPIIMKILIHLGILNTDELESLTLRVEPVIKNHRGDVIGALEACFPLPQWA